MYDQRDEWQEPQDEGHWDSPEVEDATPEQMAMSAIGGAIGAGIGALIWAGIALGLGFNSGWIALGIGWLTGFGVKKGAEFAGATNQLYWAPMPYQIIAASLAFFSYVAAKFVIVAIAVSNSIAGLFQVGAYGEYISVFMATLGFWDILWLGIMVFVAWGTPNLNED